MNITLKITALDLNTDTPSVVTALYLEKPIMTVAFDCSTDSHKIVINEGQPVADLPYYSQAMIIHEAAKMIDSHYADLARNAAGEWVPCEPYSEIMISV